MAKKKKIPLISSEELNQNLAPYAKRFLECHKSDGLGILDKGAIAAEVHREADEVNMLSELGTWFPEMADMKLGSAMNCLALHRFWTIDRPGVAEKLPARYFTKKGVSKLIYACRLERAREKAVKNGTAKNLGRYRGLDISTAGIEFVLADPDEQIEILVNPVKELESIMKRPKPVSRKKPIVADDPSISDLKSVKSASKAELQGMVTQLLTVLDSTNAEKEQFRLQRDFARTIIKLRLPEEYDAILANEDALDPDVPSELHLSTSAVDMGDKEEDPADTAAAPLVVVADGTNASEILLDEVTGGAASQVHGPNGQDIDDVLPADLDPEMAQENAETNEDSIEIEEIPMDIGPAVDEGDPTMPWNKPIAKRATSLVEAEARRGVGSSVSTIAAR